MAKSRELKSEMLIDAQQAIEDASSIVYGEYRGLDVFLSWVILSTSRPLYSPYMIDDASLIDC